MIGPQGAGKTTLMKKLVQHRDIDSGWCTSDEAIIEIAGRVRWRDLNHLDQRLLWLLRKADLFELKINGLSYKLVQSLRDEEDLDVKRKYEYLIAAQIKALAELELNISPVNLFYLMTWHYKALDRAFLLEEFNFPKTVVMDEGPFKTHYGLRYIDPEKVVKETLSAAVIYCTIDKQKNVERIMKRYEAMGNFSSIHNRINRDSVPEVTGKVHEILNENIKVIRKLGVPVMELDLGGALDGDVIRNVGEFLKQYSGKGA